MATRKKAPAKKPKAEAIEEELEDLEDLEDLEVEEDEEDTEEDEDEDTEDDDTEEDDEEDAPAPKKAKKAKKPRKRDDGKIGSAELAAALDTSGRELRVMLRQKEVEKADTGRYEWDSVDEAVEEMGFKSIVSAKKGLAASRATRLDELKERVGKKKDAEKKAAAAGTSKKSKKSKKPAPAPEPDEDEEDDEDDEE